MEKAKDAEKSKLNIKNFYKNLYSKKEVREHPYHNHVKEKIQQYENNRNQWLRQYMWTAFN